MSIEKLELVSIAGAAPSLDEAIAACLQSGVFHIENAAKLLGSTEDSGGTRSDDNPYSEALRALTEFDLRQIRFNPDQEPLPAEFSPEQILSETKRISGRLKDVREGLSAARKQIADYESAAIHLKNLTGSDLDLGRLLQCKHILYRFGRMPEENVQKLEFYSDEGLIFQAYHTAHEYVWGFYFATQERILQVDAIMKSLLFERYELPPDLSGTPEQALAELQIKLTEKKSELGTLEKQETEIYETEADLLGRMYRFAKYQSEVWKLHSQCIVTPGKFSLMGYVPVSEKEKFRNYIDRVPDLSVIYEAPWADSKVQPPVRLKNGWFTKPFNMFVEMYGLPNYNGYNPTTFVAITYTLLFGIMFGDLGQGLLLALIGVFLDKKKHFELGAIMARIGISSAVFGALYGSVFGFEEALDPLWEKTGIPFLPLKAMENTNVIIFGAVGIGAVIILISILVNIIVKLRRRNFEDAVFSNNGLAGLAFFSATLLLVIGIVAGKQLLPNSALIAVMVLTLLLMFFREPLGHWMAHKHYEMPELGDFIASNFFECFEFLLGYATNTLSFIRVGGFVFSHAGLMSVVMLLSDMIGKDHKSILTIIIGNLFVMCLEGLIVGIQVLRLEFYEVFSRCYDGDGKPFTPISVTFDDFTDSKQSEQTANA
ncbi:MAG: ATPase [Oscillospiraceae bacterium]|nr:ATPase [Oscillospiraceae bacterium]